ncbi:DUF636 domain protein [Lentinula boryana]|uniref:DUF636 domain protein n=1 Tax=Lentinula boryana TaxID=40481 RepID=A0ABQ8QGQ6_9AGAR|nr:DUF636 domain protein [Lentinula boryana]
MRLSGSCYCHALEYKLELESPDAARTSLCHCSSCKVKSLWNKLYGLTAKVPLMSFQYTSGKPKKFVGDNGSETILHRKFCDICGSFILEYGDPVKDDFRFICLGSLDEPDALPPKGEFFCESRSKWMPEIPGTIITLLLKERMIDSRLGRCFSQNED